MSSLLFFSAASSRGALLHRTPAALLRPAAVRMMSDGAGMQAIAGFKTTFKVLKEGKTRRLRGGGQGLFGDGACDWRRRRDGKKVLVHEGPWPAAIPVHSGRWPSDYRWDQGLLGMAVGEERLLVIPAAEGYGEGGFPQWGIPAGGTLEFTLEVLSIES